MNEDVLIVGAGIGGCALAHALRKRNISFQLIEKAPVLKPVGAGITLTAGAVALLKNLGIDLSTVGREILRMQVTEADGTPIGETQLDEPRRRLGPSFALHRHELHDALTRGLQIQLGTEVRRWTDAGNHVEAEFLSGRMDHFRILVGADGIHSTIRRAMWPGVAPQYAGYTCWRAVVQAEGPDHVIEAWGPGRRFGIVPLTAGRYYLFATLNAPVDQQEPQEGRAARLRTLFADFKWSAELLANVKDEEVLRSDIGDVLAPHWTHRRAALLGDAAHATTPNMGFGATLAIEDAWVLAEELATTGLTEAALHNFERRRFRRAVAIQKSSRRLGAIAQWENPIGCSIRNFFLRRAPNEQVQRSVMKALLEEPAVAALAH